MNHRRGILVVLFVVLSAAVLMAHSCLGADTDGSQTGKKAAKLSVSSLNKSIPAMEVEDVRALEKAIIVNVHKFERVLSSRLGPWASGKLVGSVTIVGLLSSLILLGLVLLFDRVVRLVLWVVEGRVAGKRNTGAVWLAAILEAVSRPLSLFIIVWGVYLAAVPLLEGFRIPSGASWATDLTAKIVELVGTIAVLWFIFRLANGVVIRLEAWAQSTEGAMDDMLVRLFGTAARVLIIIVGGMLVIQNVTGMEIGPLIASLGLGGLAFALAAKDSIANLFGTITIMLDRPFHLGDRVKIGDFDGIVEHIGYRSTRIRTMDGHLVSIPNQTVMNAALENVTERPFLKWSTTLTLTYDTPREKIERALEIMHEILDDHEGRDEERPPRVHFNSFNDWNLALSINAWYSPPDFWAFQDWIQKTCLEILRRFEEEGIEFAFPSQTVYLAYDEKRRVKLEMIKGDEVAA